MERKSFIKCILGIAVAPKVLSELELNSPLVKPKVEEFIGIIPSVMNSGYVHNYELGAFRMDDFMRIYEQTGHLIWKDNGGVDMFHDSQ